MTKNPVKRFFEWLFDPCTSEFYPAVFYLGVIGVLFVSLVVAFIISPLMLGALIFAVCFGAPIVGFLLRRDE